MSEITFTLICFLVADILRTRRSETTDHTDDNTLEPKAFQSAGVTDERGTRVLRFTFPNIKKCRTFQVVPILKMLISKMRETAQHVVRHARATSADTGD